MKMWGTFCLFALLACEERVTYTYPNGKPGEVDAGAEASTGASPMCMVRKGNYQYVDAYVSGNCGDPLGAMSFNIADATQEFAVPYVVGEKVGAGGTGDIATYYECTGAVNVSDDNCEVEYAMTCPLHPGPGSKQLVGTIKWSQDGKRGESAVDFTVFDEGGAVLCKGKYTHTVSK